MGATKKFLTLVLLFCFYTAKSQHDFSAKTWYFFDSSIANRRNLNDLLNTAKTLEQKAIAEQKHFFIARCQYYQILIKDRKTEDSLFFKNSALLDEMLAQKQHPAYELALHLLLAKRISSFVISKSYQNRKKYERADIPVNYAKYSDQQLDSIAQIHFEKAKIIGRQLTQENIDEALWLSSDPLQFLFKPILYDIAVSEQILSLGPTYNQRNQTLHTDSLRTWLSLSPDAFIAKVDSAGKRPDNFLKELKPFSEWMSYHKSNPESYYFIESLIRKFVNNKAGRFDADKLAYENYLLQLNASPYNMAKAHGLYQLCLLWNKQSENYFPGGERKWDQDEQAYIGPDTKNYDTAYRYHAAKALQLFKDNRALLDSFGYLKNILLNMESKILKQSTHLYLQQTVLPGEPMLAELKFKNADTFYYRIVSFGTNFILPTNDLQEKMNILLRQKTIRDTAIPLSTPPDHNYHLAYINLGQVPAGHYAIILSPKPINDTLSEKDYCLFKATNITVLNNDRRVYILHRMTGMPLKGAKATAHYAEQIKTEGRISYKHHYKNFTVNSRGYIEILNAKYNELTIFYGADTIKESNLDYNEPDAPEDIYSKEEYDDLVEFYDENAQVVIYTDRSIYRPGQTVFYKAVFYTTHKKTGERIVMNRQNLKGKLFGSVYKKWLKEWEPLLEITDPFGKKMDTIKIKPNDYGSVSGSFKIPKTAATGEWEIEPDYIDIDWDYGRFKVEEYKRPTYEIKIENPKKELKPGDAFSFIVKVKSFSGAPMNNVLIKYNITRSGDLPKYDSLKMKIDRENVSEDLVDTSGYTNMDGELEITIKDSLLRNYSFDNEEAWSFRYYLEAEAVDATGESFSADESLSISTRPVKINIPLSAKYERGELAPVSVTTTDENAGPVSKSVKVKIYKVAKNEKLFSSRKFTKADIWLYDKEALQRTFPFENILREEAEETKELVLEKNISTADKEKLELDSKIFSAGNYLAEFVCEENGLITGKTSKEFAVFEYAGNKLPNAGLSFHYLPFNTVSPGSRLKLNYGNSLQPVYSIFNAVSYSSNQKKVYESFYTEQLSEKGLQQFEFNIPASASHHMKLAHIYVLNNEVYTYTQTVYISNPSVAEPEIIVEKYRKKLSPGSKETFSVSIKTKNEYIAAELMTTMYDASLDQLEKHDWRLPRNEKYRNIYLGWPGNINAVISNNYTYDYPAPYRGNNFEASKPLWWLNPLEYAYSEINNLRLSNKFGKRGGEEDLMGDFNNILQFNLTPYARWNGGYDLTGRVSGLQIANTAGLDEVEVKGYGATTIRAMKLASSVITIRGVTSLKGYNQHLIILDGIPFTGDVNSLDVKTITEALVFKGADAVALYGARAAQGVLIVSTKGPIILPKEPEPVIVPRKNFSETAFFFPSVYADRDGYYTFSFTMPESVTEWNWKMLAHTKNALFVYAQKKLNTQLPLMVQPNMPRLLYQGDRIILQNRITNLDTATNTGKVVCKIEDVVTGEDITSKLVAAPKNNFTVNSKANIASPFEIKVPAGQQNPLKIIITVRSESFADGEEHIIPVLSPKVFVKENKPFYFKTSADTTVQLPKLPVDAEMYGLGLSVQPQPQAALVYSLPYLANYPYGCAEQTFNKLLAYATACKKMRQDTALQHSYEKAKAVIEKENSVNEQLPGDLAEETMPWLNLSNHTAGLQQQLFNLLDTSRSKSMMDELLQKLRKMQNSDGGITWFNGGEPDFYISSYLLRGFGYLSKNQMQMASSFIAYEHAEFIKRLAGYTDRRAFTQKREGDKSSFLYYAYSRSYWLDKYPLDNTAKQHIKTELLEQFKRAGKNSLYRQALLIITGFRYANDKNDDLYVNASAELNSVYQQAIEDEQNGLRWKELADSDDLTNSAEETIALLAEAFEAGEKNELNSKIVKWLLTVKTSHNWGSTKATAAAINLLQKENKPGEKQLVSTNFENNSISVGNDLLSGSGFDFLKTNKTDGNLLLKKQEAGPASGNVYRYYFTTSLQPEVLNKDVQLQKEFFKWDGISNKWSIVKTSDTLKIADKLKVIITIESSRALKYVFLDDKRAALFEPGSNSSGYEYETGMDYYKSVRDAGFQFFISNVPSGQHKISYELNVAYEGSFFSGPAVLQCMYKPEITAFSNTAGFISVK